MNSYEEGYDADNHGTSDPESVTQRSTYRQCPMCQGQGINPSRSWVSEPSPCPTCYGNGRLPDPNDYHRK